MEKSTELLCGKIKVENNTNSVVNPIYQCSAFTADSSYFYSRKNNPNVQEFENVIKILEEARYAIAVSTGMSALYAILDLLSPGETLLINKDIYGCSYKLFQRVCCQRKINLEIMDLSCQSSLEVLPENIDMVVFETPTNPFLKTINIAKISKAIKSINKDAIIVVDNTWATSLFQHPLKLGADISLHSCTKYFSGHSDVMGGIILTDSDDLNKELLNVRFYGGLILTPYHAWLLCRSMQTFCVRMKHHEDTTEKMVDFLQVHSAVIKVYYPDVDGNQLSGYGGIVFFEIRKDLVGKYRDFSKALKLFETGTGMACVNSMVAQPYTGSHASMTSEEKQGMDLKENLVRLCFGLEDIEDLKKDISQAFNSIGA